jgi:acyl-coenzyme A synthetase/AMP-(fatty) acid ligase
MESLKTIVSAAAPLGKDTEETVRKRLNLDIKQAWGECNVESRQWVNEVENSCCLI